MRAKFFAAALLLALLAGASSAEPARLTVLHTNDLHGQLRPLPPSSFRTILRGKRAGGFAHLATLVEHERQQARKRGGTVLLLDAGDLFQGTPLGNETRGDAVIDAMNLLDYDAVAVGNHEFDFGIANLLRLAERARFPLIAANLELAGQEPNPIGSQVLLTPPRAPCRIVIFGLITPQTPEMTTPALGDRALFRDVASTVRRLMNETDADLHIALTHLGFGADRELARAVPELDLIVSGHSHTPRVHREGGVLITQAHARGMSLGRVDFELERGSWKVLSANAKHLPIDPAVLAAAPAIQKVLEHHARGLDERMAKVVGRLTAPLRRAPGLGSSPAGNWMSDVIRREGKAMVGITNKGGIRCDLEPGPVTLGDLYRLMPFDNTVISLDLSGAAIRALVERHLGTGGHPALEWSGMRVEAIRDGEKLVPVRIEVAGRLLEEDEIYRVATNTFLAAGGDGFTEFRQGRNPARSETVLRELLARALAEASPLAPPADDRLILPRSRR